MQYKVFSIPLFEGEELMEEMNRFLRGHKVIQVQRQLLPEVQPPCWTFCVEYLDVTDTRSPQQWHRKEKVDYKSVLDESTFKVFSRLREIRKKLADDDAVPAYSVFTDAELSEIARLLENGDGNLLKINGIGVKKVEKYGEMLCRLYNDSQVEL